MTHSRRTDLEPDSAGAWLRGVVILAALTVALVCFVWAARDVAGWLS